MIKRIRLKDDKKHIDINCDLGEGIGNESELMPFISSCNIACGGHAGDEETIKNVIALAKENNVKIGAHPSFPDRENFGREEMKIGKKELKNSLHDQISLVQEICKKQGVTMHHIKPHGALYNLCNIDEKYAQIVLEILIKSHPQTVLYAPYKSVISELAKGKIKVNFEGFADRNYEDNHTLVSRKKTEALLHENRAVLDHVLRMAKHYQIKTISGKIIATKANTICVHGDTPEAVKMVKFLHENLPKNGVHIS